MPLRAMFMVRALLCARCAFADARRSPPPDYVYVNTPRHVVCYAAILLSMMMLRHYALDMRHMPRQMMPDTSLLLLMPLIFYAIDVTPSASALFCRCCQRRYAAAYAAMLPLLLR